MSTKLSTQQEKLPFEYVNEIIQADIKGFDYEFVNNCYEMISAGDKLTESQEKALKKIHQSCKISDKLLAKTNKYKGKLL